MSAAPLMAVSHGAADALANRIGAETFHAAKGKL
jgi:hypothetical protein